MTDKQRGRLGWEWQEEGCEESYQPNSPEQQVFSMGVGGNRGGEGEEEEEEGRGGEREQMLSRNI